MKCNIEGAEIDLLNIEKENIKKIENISIECHDFLDFNNNNLNTFKPLIDYLSNCGFKIYLNYKKSNLTLI